MTIRDEDREAAHAAFVTAIRSGSGNVQRCPAEGDDTMEHSWLCDSVAQALADARERENLECEELALKDQREWGNRDFASNVVAAKIAARRGAK